MRPPDETSGLGDVSRGAKPNASEVCPPPTVWEGVASGTVSEDVAMAYLRHAAKCRNCSGVLAELMALDVDDPTPEEEALLKQLSTSSEAGQSRLASRLYDEAQGRPQDVLSPIRSAPKRLFWAVAVLSMAALCLVAALVVSRLWTPSNAQLLALAYDKQRPSELRIPGGNAVPLASPTRGTGGGDRGSSELLEIELRSQKQFEKNPNDARLRQTLGRIAIVKHDGETALRQFEMAEALSPHLSGLKFDLGTAYFEIAESTDKPLDYARAIDFFGQHLQDVHRQDPVALFDQGLCWERENIEYEAVKDFEAALALEKDSGWRKEIARHLQTLKTIDGPGRASAPTVAGLTPTTFLARRSDTPGEYESYFNVSLDWLPHRGEDLEVAAALRQLAAMGTKHGDAWLGDILKHSPTPAEIAAEQTLAQALQAGATGSPDRALTLSASAMKLFDRADNQPGVLLARVEHVYSLQLMGRGKDCLAEAVPLTENADIERYAWQRVYLQLEISACHAIQGNFPVGLRTAQNAKILAGSYGLPQLGTRATGFIITNHFREGHLQTAWNMAIPTLANCCTLPGTGYRQFQLLYELESVAKALNLFWTETGLAEAEAKAAAASGNRLSAAYAYEGLGLAQLNVGTNAEARRNFETADQLLSELGQGPATTLYRADWKTSRAALQARESGASAAVLSLASIEPVLQKADTFAMARLSFYSEYAKVLRESHRTQESFEKAERGVVDAERTLPTTRNEEEREAWVEGASQAYQLMTLDLAEAGKTLTALRSWEFFRSAPFRVERKFPTPSNTADLTLLFPSPPDPPPGTLNIVFAHVQNQYIAWSISDDPRTPIHFRDLSASAEAIENQLLAFDRLCEDPRSSQPDIALLGTILYNNLLAPFQDQIDRAKQIRLDVDPSLSKISFAALMHEGHFFGLEHPLLFLPPWWSLGSNTSETSIVAQEKLPANPQLLVLRESSSKLSAHIPAEYDESNDIVAQFSQAQVQLASLRRSGSSLTALGGAGLQSMLAKADVVHYSGHGLDEDLTIQVPAEQTGQTPVVIDRGSLKHCLLAVLSACRTLGERENFPDNDPSFERMVLSSGAAYVIGTHWDVDSAMTRKLMIRFYAELADHQTFTEALRRAQQQLQSNMSSSHPYFWAPFQLVGQ